MKQSSTTSRPARRRVSKPAATTPSAPAADPADSPIPREEIARLAHSYWEARGSGTPQEDWHRAETELKARRAAAAQR